MSYGAAALGLPEGGSRCRHEVADFLALLPDRTAARAAHLLRLRTRRRRLRALPRAAGDRRRSARCGRPTCAASLPSESSGDRRPRARRARSRRSRASSASCVENEQIDRDPALVLRTPKKREALPDVLDRRELARLLDATERDDVWKRQHARQARARPAPARALRLRRPTPERAARARLAGRRPRAASAADPQGQGRPPADRADPPRARAALRRLPAASARATPSRRSSSASRAGGSRRRS